MAQTRSSARQANDKKPAVQNGSVRKSRKPTKAPNTRNTRTTARNNVLSLQARLERSASSPISELTRSPSLPPGFQALKMELSFITHPQTFAQLAEPVGFSPSFPVGTQHLLPATIAPTVTDQPSRVVVLPVRFAVSTRPQRLVTIPPPFPLSTGRLQPFGSLEPFGLPPAWAVSRPELCDAIPWFRSTQGGCYFLNGTAYGVLIDGDGGKRTYLDDEVIITRIGGGCDKEGGELVLRKDVSDKNYTYKALMHNWRHQIPVGAVIGDRNTVCPTKVPYRYNVMGFFHVTDVWHEKNDGRIGAQFRLEKIDLASKSWWAYKYAPDPLPVEQRPYATTCVAPFFCGTCRQTSHQVYAQGWMCLHSNCSEFWKLNGQHPPKDLTFAPGFLTMRRQQLTLVKPQYSLVPDLLATFPQNSNYSRTMRMSWKGIVCPHCKRCLARTLWQGWVCDLEEGGCGFTHFDAPTPVDLRSIISDFEMGAVGHRYPANNKGSMEPYIQYLKNYRLDTYDLGMGNILTHLAANNTINSRAGGPNDMFRSLCMEDIGLKRHRLKSSVVTNTLTSHFAVNFGMPYKYIVAVDSRPFQGSPPFLLKALGRLTWAVEKTVPPADFQRPNELLTLGYFEKMGINYHDDGEDTLGPTIATLSLGAEATMQIRLKQKYFKIPKELKKNSEPNDVILPSCAMEQGRRELKAQYDTQQISLRQYWTGLQDLQQSSGSRKEASAICSLQLHHGDMIVMHGENLQKYYEHAVTPDGELRFALTARYVMPERVEPIHHWKGDYIPSPDYVYDGDE